MLVQVARKQKRPCLSVVRREPAMTADAAAPDYNAILHANLNRVFNERDDVRRAAVVAELFVADPVMFEPDGIVQGRAAISDTAGRLLQQSERLDETSLVENARTKSQAHLLAISARKTLSG
eukprot:gene57021-78135_t